MATHFTWIDFGVLILYFGGMASLGPLFVSKNKTTEGYLLGDRSFPGWLIGFSMFATSISSVTFVAYPADGFRASWFRMLANISLPIAIVVATFFFLPFFRRNNIISAYEYLEGRFGPWTRLYAACAFIVMQLVRVSLILYLVSVLINSMTGLPVYVSILLGGVITSFYTVLGGIRAVLWTDFIQAIVLFGGGLVILLVIAWRLPGGFGQIFFDAWNNDPNKFGMYDLTKTGELIPVQFSPDFKQKTISLFVLVGLGNWLLEYSANQNVIQRYAASKSARQARIAMWVCCAFSVPTWALFYLIGTSLWVYFRQFADEHAANILAGTGGAKAEEILPYFVIKFLPAGLSGLVIAGVLAAAMSSLSSSISSVASVGLVDIYRRRIAKDRDDKHYVRAAKLMSLGVGVVMIVGAAFIYQMQSTTVQDTAQILTALTAGGLLGLYMFGFFTVRGDDRATLLAILVTVSFILWSALSATPLMPESLKSPYDNYYTGLLGHIILFVFAYVLSLILPRRERDLTNLTVYTQDGKPLD